MSETVVVCPSHRALVRLRAPTAKRLLVVTAVCNGEMPLLPDMRDQLVAHNGIREVLAGVEIALKGVDLTATHQFRRHSIGAVYTYLLARAPTASEKLRIGSSPFGSLSPQNNHIDLAACKDDGRIQSVT